jgi:hypothetical protein
MPQRLAHVLAAAAIQAALGALFGFPLLSAGVFVAALAAALVDLDCVCIRGKSEPTPLGHSVAFAALCVYSISLCLYALHCAGTIGRAAWLEGSLSVAAGIFSHLALDAVTTQGIYTFPRPGAASRKPGMKSRGWPGWNRTWQRWGPLGRVGEEDFRLNAGTCVASMIAILVFIFLS